MKERLESVKDRIRQVADKCGRNPETVRLVAVSKTMSADKVREAIDGGAAIFGENYIQEAREKIEALSSYPVSWHFIGHLQTNKAKYVVKLFDLIHSVDTLKLARELNKQAGKINKIQEILIQVNIGEEASKSGASVKELKKLTEDISQLENLAVRGLMIIPPFYNEPEKVRPFFSTLRELRDEIRKEAIPNVAMDELSMGMTGDFETAIEEGATLVRIGTAIFGERK
ncbi:YggS family pyridoxal phosphate-dependent enzyme [Desulfonema magnum]|uniref:Pyridoxal phosphate homeostasis protein n=1 Tax=Desulfonema magnum TaxID=45655 RepID=A0A975GLY2_9BACT|nr:YggS family pyridoxal phosphate-dependent enzyme [Desulfonema magnum]QTA86114.1 Pyridoxal phosphate homeostasis protein, YggS-family [Desulfonema magnum]